VTLTNQKEILVIKEPTVMTAIGFGMAEAIGDLGKKKRQWKDRFKRSFGESLRENGGRKWGKGI